MNFNHFAAIAANLKAKAVAAVKDTAPEVRDSAAGHSRVDTSSLQVGWYVTTNDADGYAAAVSAAEGANPGVGIVPSAGTPGPTEAFVANVVSHAEVNEYGSVDGKHSAEPMLHPALDEARAKFDERLSHLLDVP